MNFSMIFSAIDKASKPIKAIMASEKKLASAMKLSASKSQRAAAKTSRSMRGVSTAMNTVKRSAQSAFNGVVAGARASARAIKAAHRQSIAFAKSGLGNIKSGAKKVLRGAALGVGVLAAAYGGAALAAGKLVTTASEFEKFQTMLVTSEGSASGAQKAMSWINTFATKTPYQLQEVTKAFIALRSAGLDPTRGLMTSTGDAAAAMGIPIMQAVEAVKDAVVGENERLKELGITAAVKGNNVTYTYMMDGQKKIARALKSDPAGIQKALESIFDARFGGSMSRLSKTWDGMLSTLAGAWDTFKVSIMNSGLFDWMKDKLQMLLDKVMQMQANGDLDKWAKSIGTSIQTVLENAWDFATRAYEVIGKLSGYMSKAAEYVGGWENLGLVLAGIAFGPTLIATAAGIVQIASGLAMLGTALMANPISLAVAAIAGGVYLIYQNWDAIAPYFKSLWNGIKTAASTVWEWMKTAFAWTPLGIIIANWAGISAAIGAPIEAAKKVAMVAWEGIKTLFSWSPAALVWNLPSLNVAPLSAVWDKIKALFDWSPLSALDKTFGGIPGKIGGYISEAADLAGSAWSKLKNVFSDDSAVEIAARDPASMDRAVQAAGKLEAALVGARFVDMSGVSSNINKLMAEAGGLKSAVSSGVGAAQSYLAGQSFHHHGVRLMDTMAAGMKARTQVVVNQIRAAMQQVRNHLPSSPAKVGPLSDIHRLKFGETIAGSINASPMVKAMRVATAATMAAASPVASSMAIATNATPASAVRSELPSPASARSMVAPQVGVSGKGNGGTTSKTVSVSYNPRIEINGASSNLKAEIMAVMDEERRKLKRLIDDETHRERRKDF